MVTTRVLDGTNFCVVLSAIGAPTNNSSPVHDDRSVMILGVLRPSGQFSTHDEKVHMILFHGSNCLYGFHLLPLIHVKNGSIRSFLCFCVMLTRRMVVVKARMTNERILDEFNIEVFQKVQNLTLVVDIAESSWHSLLRIRGSVSEVFYCGSSARIRGERCPFKVLSVEGNTDMVDLQIAVSPNQVDNFGLVMVYDLVLPPGFSPKCFASEFSETMYLAVIFEQIETIQAFDITPLGCVLRWDLPGICNVFVSEKRVAQDLKTKYLEILNTTPGTPMKILVVNAEAESVSCEIRIPEMTKSGLLDFYKSREHSNGSYDLRGVSDESVMILRKSGILSTGENLALTSSEKPVSVVESGTTRTLDKRRMYLVPDFTKEDDQFQFVCLQDPKSAGSHLLQFDKSETYVRYKGSTFTCGQSFRLGNLNATFVKGSIILDFTESEEDSDDIDIADANKVETAGDVILRDILMRTCKQVSTKIEDDDTYCINKYFVYDSSTGLTSECVRVRHGLDSSGSTGCFAVDLYHSGTGDLVNTLSTDAQTTVITTYDESGSNSMNTTIDSTGLSFDSDNGSIYFGADKDFRIHFSEANGTDPACLKVQSLSGEEYVTKMLLAAESL